MPVAIANEGASALASACLKRYCASSIMTITCSRHPAHKNPFLTSRVDTNLTPTHLAPPGTPVVVARVFVMMRHAMPRILHVNVTAYPTALWTLQ
jgi:hypothetical protein